MGRPGSSLSGFIIEAVRVRRRLLAEALGFVKGLVDRLFSRSTWCGAAAPRRIRVERSHAIARLLRALAGDGLELFGLGLALGIRSDSLPRCSKPIEPPSLVDRDVRIRLVLHEGSVRRWPFEDSHA